MRDRSPQTNLQFMPDRKISLLLKSESFKLIFINNILTYYQMKFALPVHFLLLYPKTGM